MEPGVPQLGKRMAEIRKAHNKSQEDVAHRMGIGRKSPKLPRIEHGRQMPTLRELQKFCEVVEASSSETDELFQLATRGVRGQLSEQPAHLSGPWETIKRPEGTVIPRERGTSALDDEIPEVARVLGLSIASLTAALADARREWDEAENANPESRHAADTARIIRDGLVGKTLVRYYTPERLAQGGLTLYRCTISGARIDTTIASRPDWIGSCVRLGGADEQCGLVPAAPLPPRVPLPAVARRLVAIERQRRRIWNSDSYRLVDIALNGSRLSAAFALDEYYRFLCGPGLLLDELTQAIRTAGFNADEVVMHAAELLPLRQQLLPDGAALANFRDRMCAGGIMTVFAIARPDPDRDFVIPIQRRSRFVADNQGLLCVTPTGFHEPTIDPDVEVKPSCTVFRELYEELFGGEEVERDVRRLKPDWFFSCSEPLQWLREHQAGYDLELTGVGISLAPGNYELAILLAVRNEEFWQRYSNVMRTNWELTKSFVASPLVSTRSRRKLMRLLQQPGWDGASLFSLIQGLKRLEQLDPERVQLPEIKLLMPS